MSEKTNAAAETAAEATEAAKKVDYDRLVRITIPRDVTERKSRTMRLTLNGESKVYPRGEEVEMPYRFYLLLKRKWKMRDMDDDYKDALKKSLDEIEKQK